MKIFLLALVILLYKQSIHAATLDGERPQQLNKEQLLELSDNVKLVLFIGFSGSGFEMKNIKGKPMNVSDLYLAPTVSALNKRFGADGWQPIYGGDVDGIGYTIKKLIELYEKAPIAVGCNHLKLNNWDIGPSAMEYWYGTDYEDNQATKVLWGGYNANGYKNIWTDDLNEGLNLKKNENTQLLVGGTKVYLDIIKPHAIVSFGGNEIAMQELMYYASSSFQYNDLGEQKIVYMTEGLLDANGNKGKVNERDFEDYLHDAVILQRILPF